MSSDYGFNLEMLRMLLGQPVHSCAQEKSFIDQLADPVFTSIDFEEVNDIKRRFKKQKKLTILWYVYSAHPGCPPA
jgi:hypothetical protein